MRTLTFLTLVLAGLAGMFVLREREHFWHTRPAWIMVVASAGNVAFITALAASGLLVTCLPASIIMALYVTTVMFALVFDWIKVTVFAHLAIDRIPDGVR